MNRFSYYITMQFILLVIKITIPVVIPIQCTLKPRLGGGNGMEWKLMKIII